MDYCAKTLEVEDLLDILEIKPGVRLSVCDFLKLSNWRFNKAALNYYCKIHGCSIEEGVKGVRAIIAIRNHIKSKNGKKK